MCQLSKLAKTNANQKLITPNTQSKTIRVKVINWIFLADIIIILQPHQELLDQLTRQVAPCHLPEVGMVTDK